MDYFKENHSYLVGIALRVALGSLIYGLFRKWVSGGVCHSQAVLTGKTAIVTGANTGIGLETAVDLARRGASVILACRSVERGEKATVQVRKRSGNQNVIFANLDLASLDSIRAFANKILQKEIHIHILVNNGGVALASYQQTEDGFEMHMGTNHLGHFLLTNLLLPCLTLHPHARVVTVSSSRYKECLEFDFTGMEESKSDYKAGQAYCQSKLANILFTRSLAKRLEGTSVCAYALHPGVIFRTGLIRDFYRSLSFMKKVIFSIIIIIIMG